MKRMMKQAIFGAVAMPMVMVMVMGMGMGMGVSTAAHASGIDAMKNLTQNLKNAHQDPQKLFTQLVGSSSGLEIIPTWVNDVYAVYPSATPEKMFFLNEKGTFFGVENEFFKIRKKTISPFSRADKKDLNVEILHNLAYQSIPKLVFGDGGKQKFVLVSAVDCPDCMRLENSFPVVEKKLQSEKKELNATIYVIPGSINHGENLGQGNWKKVAAILCSHDKAQAWKNAMAHESMTNETCQFTPKLANQLYLSTKMIFLASGLMQENWVPQFINEAGSSFRGDDDTDGWYTRTGKPLPIHITQRWLASDAKVTNKSYAPEVIKAPS